MTFSLTAPDAQPTREQRETADAYDTPEPLARAICLKLSRVIPEPRTILEPSAGTGVFLRAAEDTWPTAHGTAIDIAPRGKGIEQADFLNLRPQASHELVLGNPPWSLALEFVEHGLRFLKPYGHLVFLLRTSFWHGQERVDRLYRKNPPRWWLPLRERPSYTGDGKSDSVDSAVFIWQRGHSGHTEVLAHLSWRAGRG